MAQLMGVAYLGRDAELRTTPNGDSVCNLALAFSYGRKDDQGKRPTQWVDASLWGRQAEVLEPYLLKGQQVYVIVDDIHIETYPSQNGTGHKLVGRVMSLAFCGGGQNSERQAAGPNSARQPAPRQQNTQRTAPQRTAPAPQPSDDYYDDQIPF